MVHYVIVYESCTNAFQGKIIVEAENLVQAKDKFFEWLKKQPVYQHMWNLSISIEKIESAQNEKY